MWMAKVRPPAARAAARRPAEIAAARRPVLMAMSGQGGVKEPPSRTETQVKGSIQKRGGSQTHGFWAVSRFTTGCVPRASASPRA